MSRKSSNSNTNVAMTRGQKAAETRRRNKLAKEQAAAKQAQAVAETAAPAAPAAPEVTMLVRHTTGSDHKSRYSQFPDHKIFSAHTLGALLAAGLAKVFGDGFMPADTAGNLVMFKSLTSPSAYTYWKKRYDSDTGKISPAGQAVANARVLDEKNSYYTPMSLVQKVANAMEADGKGTVEHGGKVYRYDSRVAIKVD